MPKEKQSNDFSLNIARYVDAFDAQIEIDLMTVRNWRMQLKAQLHVLEVKMDGCQKELGYEK